MRAARVEQSDADVEGGGGHLFAGGEGLGHFFGVPEQAAGRGEFAHRANDARARAGQERHGDAVEGEQGGEVDVAGGGAVGLFERGFHGGELFVVGEADAVLEPVGDLGRGESPLAGDAAAGQLAAVGETGDLGRHHVQVSGEAGDVEVFVGQQTLTQAKLQGRKESMTAPALLVGRAGASRAT